MSTPRAQSKLEIEASINRGLDRWVQKEVLRARASPTHLQRQSEGNQSNPPPSHHSLPRLPRTIHSQDSPMGTLLAAVHEHEHARMIEQSAGGGYPPTHFEILAERGGYPPGGFLSGARYVFVFCCGCGCGPGAGYILGCVCVFGRGCGCAQRGGFPLVPFCLVLDVFVVVVVVVVYSFVRVEVIFCRGFLIGCLFACGCIFFGANLCVYMCMLISVCFLCVC